jgi:hypothetical protein
LAFCKYHRDRQGIGVCMRCRAVICMECSTRLDGINHCHACLKELGRSQEASSPGRFSNMVGTLLILAASGLFFVGVFWLVEGIFAP